MSFLFEENSPEKKQLDKQNKIELLKIYSNSYEQSVLTSAITQIFFILINTLFIIANCVLFFSYVSIASNNYMLIFFPTAFIIVIEIAINCYWFMLSRQQDRISEFKYKELNEFESTIPGNGLFNQEWIYFGNLPNKSDCFNFNFKTIFPLLFLYVHIGQFITIFFIITKTPF